MVSESCEHRGGFIGSIGHAKNAELVEDVCSVWDGRKQPFEVVLIDTLREEGDDCEKRPASDLQALSVKATRSITHYHTTICADSPPIWTTYELHSPERRRNSSSD